MNFILKISAQKILRKKEVSLAFFDVVNCEETLY